MNRGVITISETGAITIPPASVWMTPFEIADLFGFFPATPVRQSVPFTRTKKWVNLIQWSISGKQMELATMFTTLK